MGGRALRSGVRAAQRRDNRCVPRPRDPAGAARRRLQPAAALHPDALAGRAPGVDPRRRGLSRHRPAATARGAATVAPRARSVARPVGGELGEGCRARTPVRPGPVGVVGAVAIRPAGIAPGWLGGWTLPALALFAAAA